MENNSLDANPDKPSLDKARGTGKRGALSLKERKYIEKNISIKNIDELSQDIGKSAETIRKYAYKKNLVTKEDTQKNSTALEEAKCRAILRHREYWAELKQQFTVSELKVFEQTWAKLWIQFSGDVLASEEIQMKKYITLEIMRDRFGKQIFNCIKEIEELETKLIQEKQKSKQDKDEIRFLKTMIDKVQTNHMALAKNQRESMDSQKQIESQLKVSRDDRIKSITDATKNWTSVIKLLSENAEVRDSVGKQIELTRMAKDASQVLLTNYHTYIDGTVDKPILSKDSIGELNED